MSRHGMRVMCGHFATSGQVAPGACKSPACQTRNSRATTGGRRASGRQARVSVTGAVRRARPPRSSPPPSLRAWRTFHVAPIAGAPPCARPGFAGSTTGRASQWRRDGPTRVRRVAWRTMPKRSTRAVSARPRAGKRSSPAQGATGVDSVDLARETLQAICRDKTSPASARAQAARTLLELSGALRNASVISTTRPASEMTAEELDLALAQHTPDATP